MMYLFYVCHYINKFKKKKKNNPCKSWVKYQKSCHNPSPFPREREGSLTAKSPNLLAKIRLNRTHSFLKITSKSFQIYPLSFSKKFQRIKQNSLNLPTYFVNNAKFASIIDPFTLCFRYLPQQRTLRNSSELHKFCAVRPHTPRIT